MNDDFYSVFAKEWELQTGSQMLKNKNAGFEWKKTVAKHFFFKAIDGANLFFAHIVENNEKLKKENEKLKYKIEAIENILKVKTSEMSIVKK